MQLATNRVLLRPAGPADYPVLHRMELDEAVTDTWRHQGRTPSPEQFVQSFWGGVLIQSVVEAASDGRPVGMLTAYDASLRNGTVHVAVLSTADAIGTGAAFEGLAVLITHLFTEWPFRRVLAESFSATVGQYSSALSRICTEEGRLVADRRTNGVPSDRIYLGIDRAEWMARYGDRVLRRLRPVALAAGDLAGAPAAPEASR